MVLHYRSNTLHNFFVFFFGSIFYVFGFNSFDKKKKLTSLPGVKLTEVSITTVSNYFPESGQINTVLF